MSTTKITIALGLLLAAGGVAQGQDQPRERRDSEPRRGAEELRDRERPAADRERPALERRERQERQERQRLQRERTRDERPDRPARLRERQQAREGARQPRPEVCPECHRPLGPFAGPGMGFGQGQMRGQGPAGPMARNFRGRAPQFQGPPFRYGAPNAPRFGAPQQNFGPGFRGQRDGQALRPGAGMRGPGAFGAPLQDRRSQPDRPALRDGERPVNRRAPIDRPRPDQERERDRDR